MFANVGTVDRVVRAIAGVVLISYAAVSHGLVRWIGLVGVVLPITTVVRFCPAYGWPGSDPREKSGLSRDRSGSSNSLATASRAEDALYLLAGGEIVTPEHLPEPKFPSWIVALPRFAGPWAGSAFPLV